MIRANMIPANPDPHPTAAVQGPERRGGEHGPRSIPMR
jgi:hypothetical protein